LRPRVRECGIKIGILETGEENSITDVPGVRVGHATLIRGSGKLSPGHGPVRTGVTVILPHEGNVYREKVRAGVDVQNGAGELTGALQVMEWGILETPIALTSTLNVGLVHDAIVDCVLDQNPDIGIGSEVILPVVGECDDSYLNDARGRHVKREHVQEAIANAGKKVPEGSVGAGTGMSTLGFKSGVGTASRRLSSDLGGHVLGVLVVANFGSSGDLCIDGVPVGRELPADRDGPSDGGSIVTVIATDAPVTSLELTRIAARVPLALGRVGSTSSDSSGDVSIAFSSAERIDLSSASPPRMVRAVATKTLDAVFRATVEATEEAILNSIFTSETMKGRDDNVSPGLPIDETLKIMRKHGRM